MKRMLVAIVIVVVLGGWLAAGRLRVGKRGGRISPAVQTPRPQAVWGQPEPAYPDDTPEKRALLRQLKREERKQRPQEGRN